MVFRLCYGLFLQLVMVSIASLGRLFLCLCFICCKVVHTSVEENDYLIVFFLFVFCFSFPFICSLQGFLVFLHHRNGWS